MPETNINQLIEDAVLMRPDQKKALLPLTPGFTQDQHDALAQIIGQEPEVVKETFDGAVNTALKEGDAETLALLSDLAEQAEMVAKRESKKAAEESSRQEEAVVLEELAKQLDLA